MSGPNQNNASGLSPRPVNDAGLFLLPTRGEKRIIPIATQAQAGRNVGDFVGDTTRGFTSQDFTITAALQPFDNYIQVRIPGRGVDSQGNPNPNAPAIYDFLINPSQVQVNKQQDTAQALTRGGWQNGVKSEDFTVITLEGKTPGKYFSDGLTDLLTDFTVSYRNLLALELVVENNGYWFEGEQANEGPLAAGFTRRQIKMHSDVELTVGEYIWYGMFESLDIDEDAENPFLASFSVVFIAWREHYRKVTPYPNPIGGAVERGHIPNISLAYGGINNPAGVQAALGGQVPINQNPQLQAVLATITPPNVSLASAGLTTTSQKPNLPAIDSTPMSDVFNPTPEVWNS